MTDAPFVVEEERVKFRQRQAKNATRRYKQQMAELRDLLTATDDAVDSSAARTNLISAAAKLSQLQTTLATTSVERESDDARQLFKLALAHGDAGDTWRPSIIYCDPPWAYGNPSHVLGTKHHYDTMSDDALAALPVAALAGDDRDEAVARLGESGIRRRSLLPDTRRMGCCGTLGTVIH